MSEHDEDGMTKGATWLKSQLTLTNIVVGVTFIVSMVTWQQATEARNEMQDYRLKAIEEMQRQHDVIYMRRDIVEERFDKLREQIDAMDKKLDLVRAAVR